LKREPDLDQGEDDVTGNIPSRRAIDDPLLVDLELIFGAACLTPIGFLWWCCAGRDKSRYKPLA
jgi:hypothetical protein